MIVSVLFACLAGLLVGLSRQLNGRLSLSSSPLISSFWNHFIGFAALSTLALITGQALLPAGIAHIPWYAYLGGPVGVVFVAAGSWVITRIGAINTALLLIGGQMISGIAFDLFRSKTPTLWMTSLGVMLIIAGVLVAQRRKADPNSS